MRRVILCAGLKGSGSTWLYNVVTEILKEGACRAAASQPRSSPRIMQFYADAVSAFPPQAASVFQLVIKTHVPDESLNVFAAFAHASVLLTIREPRDSVASVMQRFGHPFDTALGEIAAGSARLAAFRTTYDPPVFRYEDRFFERPETIAQLARILRVPLAQRAAEKIFKRHTRPAVAKRIRALEKQGAFGQIPDPDRFDPASHWHPGHIGDAASGKFASVLSSPQQRRILSATAEFRRAFGYGSRRA